MAEPFFGYDLIGYRKLEVGGLFCKHRCPAIKILNPLPFQFFWPEIFKDQVHFRQAVRNGCAGQKSYAQIGIKLLLKGTHRKKHIERLLAAIHIAQPGHPCVPCGKR